MGARVYHVTFTKTFETTILAESEESLLEALNEENPDEDDWDIPDWEYTYSDMVLVKPLPRELPEFDAAVIRDQGKLVIVAAEGDDVEGLRQRAEEELNQLHLERKQLSLFPPEKCS
jgi:hypothetical protein